MKKMIAAIILICVLPLSAVAEELITDNIDIATKDYFTGTYFNQDPLPQPTDGGAILWDITHGIYGGYEPFTRFLFLIDTLAAHGFSMDTTSAGVENIDLSEYDVLIVGTLSAWDTPYSSPEVDAIEDFVNSGKGLIVLAENTGCPNGNINPVTERFGVICGLSSIEPLDLIFTDFSDHPIFEGVSEIYYRAAGEIAATYPSQLEAYYNSLGTVACADEVPGRVVVLGDMNVWGITYFWNNDNCLFAKNVFNWLSEAQTSVDDEQSLPNELALRQNHPNPFNAQTTFEYNLTEASPVKLRVYNLSGQLITTLIDNTQNAGKHSIIWDASEAASGIYFYQLIAGNQTETKKMSLLK